jgi:hypothetical protein
MFRRGFSGERAGRAAHTVTITEDTQMRSHARGVLFTLAVVITLGWVGEAAAFIPSGGSRLLYYFSKKSFAAGAGEDTAQTLLFVTNTSPDTATRFGIKYYRADCNQEIGPVFQNLGAGATRRLDVSAEAPNFQEGVAEVFFVNAGNQPIRWDFGAGSSIIIDFPLVTVVRLPAALLHSDSRVFGGDPIASNTDGTTWAPLILNGNFADPGVVTSRLVVFAPGTDPGTVAADRTVNVDFRAQNGGADARVGFNALCGRSLPLATVRGLAPADFQTTYPAGGVVVPSADGQPKGIVGWLIEIIQLAGVADILFGQKLEGVGTVSESAHP